MLIIAGCILFTFLCIYLFMRLPQFGVHPSGKRLERIKQSPNYNGKAFQNQTYKPQLAEGANMLNIAWKFFTTKNKDSVPNHILPSQKTNLHELNADEDCAIWMGHSSYFLQWEGKRILVDPVFSGNASPIKGNIKAFKGTDIYSVGDIPNIDLLLITHDHWDHLDYKTILQLKSITQLTVCPLGVGSHLERWGVHNICELDWTESCQVNELRVTSTPAHHFSGRGFKRNQTLWSSYVISSAKGTLFLSGDGGYDSHLSDIGKHFGPIDYAFLENGQYNDSWKYIHMNPTEVLQAAKDLKAARIVPTHSSKFKLALHAWNEPLIRLSSLASQSDIQLLTPLIGEKVSMDKSKQNFRSWYLPVDINE